MVDVVDNEISYSMMFHGCMHQCGVRACLFVCAALVPTSASLVCAYVSGLSSFAEEPHLAAASLLPLLKVAEATVPKELHVSEPILPTSLHA